MILKFTFNPIQPARGGAANRVKAVSFWAAIFFLASFLFSAVFFRASAAATPEQVEAALKDLSQAYGQPVTSAEQAKQICDQEAFLLICAQIGKRHGLYDEEELSQVDDLLEDLKEDVAEKLRQCRDEECLLDVANDLARQIGERNPDLADELELTSEKIKEKKEIVDAAKEHGVTPKECQQMDPDTAPVSLLRACAKLAKDSRVQRHVPEAIKKRAQEIDKSIELKESLLRGDFQCGDNTLRGCENFCLNPPPEVIGQAAPPVCLEIARRFFGEEGARHLEALYQGVSQIREYYQERVKDLVYKTVDGRVLTNPEEIGRYIEEQGKRGNIEAVERGLNFLLTHGFISAQEKEFALKMMAKVAAGEIPDFEECIEDPEECEEFVPEEHRQEFGVMKRIQELMTAEMQKEGVPSPVFCDDPQYGERCLAAAKRALSQIEELASDFPPARAIVNEIKRHIKFGEKGLEAKKRAREEFDREGGVIRIGDSEFSSFDELEAFCRANPSVCLAEAGRKGFIDKEHAIERYKRSVGIPDEFFEGEFPPGVPFRSGEPFPGRPFIEGEFPPGVRFPGEDFFPPAVPFGPEGFFPPGMPFPPDGELPFGPFPPGFDKEAALKSFEEWLENPVGPPPIPGIILPPDHVRPPLDVITPELEACLFRNGFDQEDIDDYLEGEFDDEIIDQIIQCKKELGLPPGPMIEPPELSDFLTPALVQCLISKGVSNEDIEDMRRGEEPDEDVIDLVFQCKEEIGFVPPSPIPIICPLSPVRICQPGEKPIPPNPDDPCGTFSCVPPEPLPFSFPNDDADGTAADLDFENHQPSPDSTTSFIRSELEKCLLAEGVPADQIEKLKQGIQPFDQAIKEKVFLCQQAINGFSPESFNHFEPLPPLPPLPPLDLSSCGDGRCADGETAQSCPADCGGFFDGGFNGGAEDGQHFEGGFDQGFFGSTVSDLGKAVLFSVVGLMFIGLIGML